MGLLSNRSQRMSKWGKNVSDTLASGSSATSLFLPHFDVICDPLGTLSRDNDDGSENVGKNMNLRSFRLNRVYLDLLNISNADDFSWSWILKDFIQVQNSSSYVHVPHKTSN